MIQSTTVRTLTGAALVFVLGCAAAQATVIIEDFSNAAIASYTTYGGNIAPANSAKLPGWDIGGRYFKFEDIGTDRIIVATQDFGGYDVGIKLTAQSSEYRPAWDAAQADEALDLSLADELQFDVVFRLEASGMPNSSFNITMFYYDTSDAVARSVQILAPERSAWTTDQYKTFTVDVDAISGFDKSEDKVYGFRMASLWTRIGLTYGAYGLSSISYTQVPEPTTLALLGGALLVGALRRRRA